MKAWMLDRQEGLEALRFDSSAPDPQSGAGEALLRVEFAALNPADRYLAEKLYPAKPTFPHILGRDGIGRVEAFGTGGADAARKADAPAKGERALILRGDAGVNKPGTFAEYVSVPADLLVRVPEGWKPEAAAGAPLVYLTAWQALTQWGDLPKGGAVAITGASGGVGIASLHLAHAMGLRVMALSRGSAKVNALRAEGADEVLDPSSDSLVADLRRAAGKEGIAVAVDNIGGELFPKLVAALGYRGAISCVGRLAGAVPEFNTATLFFRRNRIGGVSAGDYTAESARKAWEEILRLLAKSGKQPLVDSVFEFDELPAAFERLAKGPLGKVVVRVGDA